MAKKETTKKQKPAELAGTKVPFNFKKHLLPPLGGLLVFVLFFGFFNSQLLSGHIAYFFKERSQTKSVTSTTTVTTTRTTDNAIIIDKNAPPKINIGKIAVDAPVIYDQAVIDEKQFQKALRGGVVRYPGTASPGETGNVVIFGHSSGQWWAPGDYKFVFSLLDKLEEKDQISLDYQGIRYVYEVRRKHVVVPTDMSVLNTTDENMLTLITCTPVGTNKKRLIIEAKQISPSLTPITVEEKKQVTTVKDLPSNAPGFCQNIKDLFN
jgi:sortase A